MRRKMNGLMYEAETNPSIYSQVIASFTLGLLFFITLLYIIIVPIACYLVYIYKSFFGAIIVGIIFSSPYWAKGHWKAFGDSVIFNAWRHYFQLRVYKEEQCETRNVLFASFPHGLFPIAFPMMSGIAHVVFPEFNGIMPVTAIASNMFKAPIISPMLTWLGCVPANECDIKNALKNNVCFLLPDGIAGVFHSDAEREQIYIHKRKGFIKIAIEEGSSLVPVYCFGHTQVFHVFPGHESWFANISRRLKFSIVFFIGHSIIPFLPRQVPIVFVIGKAIKVEKKEEPTELDVKQVQDTFKKELIALYEKYKVLVHGYENKVLELY